MERAGQRAQRRPSRRSPFLSRFCEPRRKMPSYQLRPSAKYPRISRSRRVRRSSDSGEPPRRRVGSDLRRVAFPLLDIALLPSDSFSRQFGFPAGRARRSVVAGTSLKYDLRPEFMESQRAAERLATSIPPQPSAEKRRVHPPAEPHTSPVKPLGFTNAIHARAFCSTSPASAPWRTMRTLESPQTLLARLQGQQHVVMGNFAQQGAAILERPRIPDELCCLRGGVGEPDRGPRDPLQRGRSHRGNEEE